MPVAVRYSSSVHTTNVQHLILMKDNFMFKLRYILLAALMVPASVSANTFASSNYDEFAVTDVAREQMFTMLEKSCQMNANQEPSLLLKCYSISEKRFEKLLNNNYRKAMTGLPKDGRTILRDKQRQWLSSREYACETASELNADSITYRSTTHKCHLTETYRRALWLVTDKTSAKNGVI